MNKNSEKTLLAFDFGTKRIGTAIGQSITQTARPLQTIETKNNKMLWENIAKLVQQWQPDALVVGVPLNMDGSVQNTTELAKEFAEQLEKQFKLKVYQTDERLTTKAARELLFEQGGYKALEESDVDSFAAKLILEHWFESRNSS